MHKVRSFFFVCLGILCLAKAKYATPAPTGAARPTR